MTQEQRAAAAEDTLATSSRLKFLREMCVFSLATVLGFTLSLSKLWDGRQRQPR